MLISKLPNSRYLSLFNKIRCWYVTKIMGVMNPHSQNYFEENVYLGSPKAVTIGEHCHINENVFIQGAVIGNKVMIAPNVSILHNSHNHNRTDVAMIEQGVTTNNPPIIEDDVWLARNVIVLPGVTIKKGTIVAVGAIVNKDTEAYSVYGGIPAKKIKSRN